MGWVITLSFRRSFTIHGYWPSLVSYKYYGSFRPNYHSTIMKNLEKYWPARSEAPRNPSKITFKEANFLWIWEWDKHGKDFG